MMSKWLSCSLLGMLLVFGGAAQAQQASVTPFEGDLLGVDAEMRRIVVSDFSLQLPDVLVINGEQRLAGQVVEKLEPGDRLSVRISLPDEASGMAMVREISTEGSLGR